MHTESPAPALTSDKVLIRAGPHRGKRGTIEVVQGHDRLVILLAESGLSAETRPQDIRNFSAAARQAWKTSPSRRVGRPAGRSMSRISVTLRIDASLWKQFQGLESRGLIQSRSEFIELALEHALHRAEEYAR